MHDYGAASQVGAPAYGIASAIGGVLSLGGGLPIMNGTECVGGIGTSSGTPEDGREVAQV